MSWFHLERNVAWSLAVVYASLLVTAAAIFLLARTRPGRSYAELRDRVQTWAVIILFFTVVLAVHRSLAIFAFAWISFLALKEYLSLIPTRRADRVVLLLAYLAVPMQYGWIVSEWYGMFIIFIPVYMFLIIPLAMVAIGRTDGFLTAAGTLHWGLMTTVFSLSHMAFLLVLPGEGATVAGGTGLVLYLLLLTELNDIAQYCWGKGIGGKKVVPTVSPGKSWAGLIGGIASTLVIAVLLAPVLTPLSFNHACVAGILVSLGGFFGDVTISALKRDLGIKDSGTMLPGHGGILDRVDSLTFTAPLFLHFVRWYYF